jgi:PPM family protein phosphatase
VPARRRLPAAAAASDPGRERDNNEDRVLAEPALGIFAVIDGVGGESAGEVAAETAREVLRARLSRRTTDPARLVREAIALANKQIYDRAQADPQLEGMSCVLTVAVLDYPQGPQGPQASQVPAGQDGHDGHDGTARVTVGHVGDSRLYLLRRGEIRKVTRDHSPVGVREDAGDLSEADAMRHPRRNEIFRDVGSGPHEPDDEDFVDVYQMPFEDDSALLLCSDGLSDLVAARDILDVVERRAGEPEEAVQELIRRANANGGKDNISVVLVEGERFAEGVRLGGALGTAAPANTAPAGLRRGAASARSADRPWLLWTAALVTLLALGLAGWFAVQGGLPWGGRGELEPLRVGAGDGGFATIGEALAHAVPGQTVEVAPGTYRERIVLPSGVRLVSRVPRGAVIVPTATPPGTPAAPAVLIRAARGARLDGFRIAPDPAAPLSVGLRLVDSQAEIEEVEVMGAHSAGIEILGDDRSTVRYSYVHDNPGTGIAVAGQAAPRLLHNLVAGNGLGTPARPHGGIEVRDAARPVIAENRIQGNGAPQVVLPAGHDPAYAAEIERWNQFGPAAGAPAAPSPTPSPAPASRRPRPGASR